MCKLLSDWMPSEAAINLVKLNGVTDEQIDSTVFYLKHKTELDNIDDVDGYDSWNAFFIMFCIKANRSPGEDQNPQTH